MNWHETIKYIRTQDEFKDLIEHAYFDPDLSLNVTRFAATAEFKETLRLLKNLHPTAKTLLDVGAGNGIASINFSKMGYIVTALEPDTSDTVGAEAIRQLAKKNKINDLRVIELFGENTGIASSSFDVVYVRQAMHHAYNLPVFVKELARLLKPGGLLLTVRDHVIYDEADKEVFLQTHPLHRFYGGENAFTAEEYRSAITSAGLLIEKELSYFDSVINYFPLTELKLKEIAAQNEFQLKETFRKKTKVFSNLPFGFQLYKLKNGYTGWKSYLNEKNFPGRMYSYIARKK